MSKGGRSLSKIIRHRHPPYCERKKSVFRIYSGSTSRVSVPEIQQQHNIVVYPLLHSLIQSRLKSAHHDAVSMEWKLDQKVVVLHNLMRVGVLLGIE